ncbi:MAG: type II toxin-antitoxin system RelE/ParE family toxin [Acidobacteria bacterium]|jgi:plasmid stabilization system protein ParE|nr:type II toxin-antitoxin system RelE/ParE family toxin [Acidobacteriota bacterium]
MRYIFHPEALQEYEEAVLYYSEISKNLAAAFIKCVENGIKKILECPNAWQIVEENIRRHLINRFPFGIYYSIEKEYIMIISVMHMNRKPGYWISRIM